MTKRNKTSSKPWQRSGNQFQRTGSQSKRQQQKGPENSTRHITPTLEELLSDLNGATMFSKLDLNKGYHQCELDESSRYITTFSTHLEIQVVEFWNLISS